MSTDKKVVPNEAASDVKENKNPESGQEAAKAPDVDENNRSKYDDGQPEKYTPPPNEAGK